LSGQDMLSKMHFVNQIQKIKEEGASIIMACHDKDLIDDIADVVWHIDKGRLAAGSASNYLNTLNCGYGIFYVNILCQTEYDLLDKLPFVQSSTKVGGKCKVVTNIKDSQKLLAYCLKRELQILRYEEGDLS